MNHLEPIASTLLRGRAYADDLATDHFRQFDRPLTPIARAQTMRSVIQALVLNDNAEGFVLVDSYLHFGRVEVVHDESQRHYLLKARTAMPIETTRQGRFSFRVESEPGTEPLELLLYQFSGFNMSLATVPAQAVRINGRLRFELLGDVKDIDVWAHAPDSEPFDQGHRDDFGDLSEDVHILGGTGA